MNPKEIYYKAFLQKQPLTPQEKTTLAGDAKYAFLYAVNVLRGPFQEGEKNILDSQYGTDYLNYFRGNPPPINKYTEKFDTFVREMTTQVSETPEDILSPEPQEAYKRQAPVSNYNREAEKIVDEICDKYNIEIGLTPKNMDEILDEVKQFALSCIKNASVTPQERTRLISIVLDSEDGDAIINNLSAEAM